MAVRRWTRRAVIAGLPVAAAGAVWALRRGGSTAPGSIDVAGGPTGTTAATGSTTAASEAPTVVTPPPPASTGTAPPVTAAPVDRAAVAARYAGVAPTAFGMHLPGLVEVVDRPGRVALTFDACGGPRGTGVDQRLLDLLVREQVAATLFLNARWIDANPSVVDRILAQPGLEIANHGTRHVPLSVSGRSAYRIRGTASVQEVIDEVGANHDRLTALVGRPPRWFRPGTAHYDDVAVRIVQELGERPAGFAVNADSGATASASAVAASVGAAPDRAVVLLHLNHPERATAEGVARALPRLRSRNLGFCTLSEGTASG